MTEAQIKHMVNRFLGWHLPENFNPDGGIRFERIARDATGTNLFDAAQAEAMVRHMVDHMPDDHDVVAVLLDKAATARGSADAVTFAQAASSAANALECVRRTA